MKQYTGTKTLKAKPMTRGIYNQLRGWTITEGEDPEEAGYLVEYQDGGKPNHPDFEGYISWSPADVFEKSYSEGAAPQSGTTVAGDRQLSADEIAMMNELSRTSALFLTQLGILEQHIQAQYTAAHSNPTSNEQSRLEDATPFKWLAKARTSMQEACMFARRAVAQPTGKS